MNQSAITDITPLKPGYIPEKFIDRENTETALSNLIGEDSSRNVHIQGPPGTGKTHLTLSTLHQTNSEVSTCYLDCKKHDTQYKALQQIYQSLTGEHVKSGHHTSDLQRKIQERTGAIHTVIVLDEIDFLLLNDGEDLLYHLSRMKNNFQINIVTISNQITDLAAQLEERTYSSLQPYPLQLETYTGEQTFQILLQRAQQALKPQTLQRQALTYIASTTQNLQIALQWLKTAATETNSIITENHVKNTKQQAYKNHHATLLDPFTQHHQLLLQAIKELHQEQNTINAGSVYQRYQKLAENHGEQTLSNRRLSTYLKQLELLNIIKAEYHYGGKNGKTREIQLNQL